MKTIVVFLFLSSTRLFAQDSVFVWAEKEIGFFTGIGRTWNAESSGSKSGFGTDFGIALSRKNKTKNRRLEFSLSTPTYRYSSDYFRDLSNQESDTMYRNFRRHAMLDFGLKSNVGLLHRPKFDWYLMYGIIASANIKSEWKKNLYDADSKQLLSEGVFQEVSYNYHYLLLGLQCGFLFHYCLSESFAITLEPILSSRITADIIGADGPYKFQQIRFGIRKIF